LTEINHDLSTQKRLPPTRFPENSKPIFSSESSLMDCISVKGIQQRTGVEKYNLILFILKELLDNALDFLETFSRRRKDQEPIVKVVLTNQKIIVSNSNFGLESFSEERIKSIFTFDKFYSSKRNIYRVSRGNLGDALKSVIGIPYALAEDNGVKGWNKPLIITENGTELYLIYLKVDRVEQTINTGIESQFMVTAANSGFTTIEINIPIHENQYRLLTFLRDYVILNPHITFDLDIYPDLENGDKAREIHHLPQTQKFETNWHNRPSIHYYSLPEFQQLIYGVDENDRIAYDVLKLFREASNIRRNEAQMTVGELKRDTKSVAELYSKLRRVFCSTSKLEIQFNTNKKLRQEALKSRIEQLGFKVSNVRYRLVHAFVEDDKHNIKFPFIFEIAILRTPSLPQSYIVNGINSSARYDNPFFGEYTNTYAWITSGGKQQKAGSVKEILEKYGYCDTREKSKKPSSIIIVNLVSPRIDYKGYNKRIDLTTFAKTIADTIYTICSQSAPSIGYKDPETTGKQILHDILRERWNQVKKDPDLMRSDRWTQSTVFYRYRKRLMDIGASSVTRKYITNEIKKVCLQKFGKTREELGIFAADRAQMYFKGRSYDVGIDDLVLLMKKGTDLLIIEKEGVAEVLAPFAESYGMALLNTRGFLTDYAKRLSELTESNIAILTDLDDSGLLIAKKVPDIPRIGIDFGTLTHFGLNLEDVEESYDEDHPRRHFNALEKLAEEDSSLKELLLYVEDKRVEIDSVIAIVGNKRFWSFIIEKLGFLFPYRDYNRAIDTPEFVMPKRIEYFIQAIKEKGKKAAAYEYDKIKDELEDFEGFIDNSDQKG
jgi:hypothetical protein